jgi:hypothetical protein
VRCVLGLILAALIAPCALAAELTEDPGGFNGIPWGISPAELSDLQIVKEEGDFRTFRKPDDIPVVCDIRPDDVKYQFYKNRFEAVLMTYTGKETHGQLLACAVRRFGRIPAMKNRMALRVDWEGPATVISLSYDPYAREGALWFSSRALGQERFHQLELGPLP